MTPIFYHTVHRARMLLLGLHSRALADVLPKLHDAVTSEVGSGSDVNVLEWMSRTALELIGQGGLGYSFDPLVKDVKNEYGDALKDML